MEINDPVRHRLHRDVMRVRKIEDGWLWAGLPGVYVKDRIERFEVDAETKRWDARFKTRALYDGPRTYKPVLIERR
jgi:hypothetical protein